MNNRNLISKIEKAAGVYIKAKGFKTTGDGRYEAYVSAYAIIDGVRANKEFKNTFAWQARERSYAVHDALVRMADELNVTISDGARTAVVRAEEATNTARMNLYCDTH